MNKDFILVSEVLPIYMTPSEYFDDSFQSLKIQIYKDFEFIVVDDISDQDISNHIKNS